MAEATFLIAVDNLGSLLIQNGDIPQGIWEQVEDLWAELERLRCFLREEQATTQITANLNNWISQLKEAAQDAEDAVEIFVFGDRFAQDETTVRHEMQAIRTRLQTIIPIGGRYNSQPQGRMSLLEGPSIIRGYICSRSYKIFGAPSMEDSEQQTITNPWHNNEHVVGLEEDVAYLLPGAITNDRRSLSAVGIVGIGGIGKTTLARILFNHAEVAARFDQHRAWVTVSRVLNLKEIIKQLALQFPSPPLEDPSHLLTTMERMHSQTLRVLLQRRLRGISYFIVLDDVWEHNHFEAVVGLFPDEGNASRLLITSRNRDATRDAYFIHEMRTLHPRQSWQLFLNTVFFRGDDRNCPEHLDNVGREILRKCHNLPSKIKDAGKKLVGRHSKEQWEYVLNTIDLRANSEAFESSYHALPPLEQLCFLFLSFFREGTTIRAEKLVHIWIAGGMVPQRGQMATIMEEIGRSYLDNLISRNMVEVEDTTKDDRVKYCRIYDVFHKPSVKKAKEEISFEIMEEKVGSRPIEKPRHRAIYCSGGHPFHLMFRSKYLRSLFFHGDANFIPSSLYFSHLKLLRILDFEGFGLQEFPFPVCTLIGLRYLGLRNNYIDELPDTLSSLKNLKVLDIALNFAIVVPDVIWNMDSLRHLYMSDILCRGPLRIHTLKNLQTLTYISVDNWTYERSSLQMMTNLRKLGIDGLNEHVDVSYLFISLAHLENLVCLNLRGSRFQRMPPLDEVGYLDALTHLKLDGLLTELPSADNFPVNLRYLTLVNSSLEQDPMPVLEQLSMLLYLKLRNTYAGSEIVISRMGFPKLQVLCIGDFWHLENVQVEEGAMPVLEQFEISNCPYLNNLPRVARAV